VFAYAVDGGTMSSIVNYAHKMVSPGTYRCNMCALTYGTFGTKKEWTKFIESLARETIFLHRDEFNERYPAVEDALPAVFVERDGTLSIVVDAREMSTAKTLDELIATIRRHVEAIAPAVSVSSPIDSGSVELGR
jgi:membrane protease subunit (stomatin/prohibitin family)